MGVRPVSVVFTGDEEVLLGVVLVELEVAAVDAGVGHVVAEGKDGVVAVPGHVVVVGDVAVGRGDGRDDAPDS